jgi:D-3-phosphoglycerate dehydrogenase / 2-oxoglutarate reductase
MSVCRNVTADSNASIERIKTMPMRAKVVITDYTFREFSRYEDELAGTAADLICPTDDTEASFMAEAVSADALLHEHRFLTTEIIECLDRCKIISHHGKGVDNIAVETATRRGILIANVLDASMHEVSEHVFALLLMVGRRLATYDAAVRRGEWHVAVGGALHRLHGKTMGLVGFGTIARYVAAKARAFGMNVIVYARNPSAADASEHGVRFADLDTVFAVADVVSTHLPLTSETEKVASRARLRLMKPTSIFINISRGGLVDEAALVELLSAGKIFGAGLDVLVDEPPARDHPLFKLPNVVLTPHCAWYSEEGRDDVERRTAREVARVLNGQWPVSLVNPEAKQVFIDRWGAIETSIN